VAILITRVAPGFLPIRLLPSADIGLPQGHATANPGLNTFNRRDAVLAKLDCRIVDCVVTRSERDRGFDRLAAIRRVARSRLMKLRLRWPRRRMTTFYGVLGVCPDADESTIKAAFRQLAKTYHPDVTGDDHQATPRFRQIVAAYDVLKDPVKRSEYDRQLEIRQARARQARRREMCQWAVAIVASAVISGGTTIFLAPTFRAHVFPAHVFSAGETAASEARDIGAAIASAVAESPRADGATTSPRKVDGDRALDAAAVAMAGDDRLPASSRHLPGDQSDARSADASRPQLGDGHPDISASADAGPASSAVDPPTTGPNGLSGGAADVGGAIDAGSMATRRSAGVTAGMAFGARVGASPLGEWATYRDAQFAFSLTYPSDVFTAEVAPPDQPRVFLSHDGGARLVVTARAQTRGTVESQRRAIISERYADAKFDYSPVRPSWFVLSGTKGREMFYEHVAFACGGRAVLSWRLTYLVAERGFYDRIVEAIHHSFRYPGGNQPCGQRIASLSVDDTDRVARHADFPGR
jgi:curved DNA-binding protein CbpA